MAVFRQPGTEGASDTLLSRAIRACRREFVAVGLFSGVVNLLQLTVSLYMMQVFDRVLATRSLDTLIFLTIIAVSAVLLLAVLEAVRGQVMQRVAGWIEARVAPEGFERALESQLRGRPYRMEALRDLAVCRSWLGSPGALAVYDVPWVPIYLGAIFLLHPLMGFVALAGAVMLFGLTLLNEFTTSSLLRQASTAAMASQRRADAVARNAEVIDSMGMSNAVLRHWREGVAQVTAPQQKAADRAAILLSATKFFRLAVQLAVLGIGAYLVLRQEITSGASIAGSIIMGRALAPVEQLIGGWKGLVQTRQALRRLNIFLALPRIRPPGLAMPEPTGRVAAERVTYGVPGQPMAIIKGVSFGLEPGESLAVIGPSAAGKTTLIRLMIGTLAPSSGNVRLDGADVYTWKREDFGRHVGYLPQDVELFDGTVFQNIARMADAEPEAVFAAARLAGCHEMILRLPQGYETEIGEGGQHLSGGQRQLVGLARAMFGNPKLVVLDEPNSNLDGDAEAALQRAVDTLKSRGTTVVLVSHRPTLVQGVDKVLLLKDGAVEMFGPRAEVLRRLMPQPRPAAAPAVAATATGRLAPGGNA
ncbi:type I secretion system permease/ATPase [Roseomonas marmotae]|uniref:Type I secretion system permease/ATPase n=1 Tax=Roseomonas marmotae TaxID=2768161 RepID=A0ABS3KAJ4_9PROT|nr:type I secretion system permease/ATPase [Roseomonas marmotae]MBO1074488.1 type I secretion system permease/ATPase [Roseomonas marmotae]QTI78220.1 type I secretion system permease/ATPase [Roseomonas marmotae]